MYKRLTPQGKEVAQLAWTVVYAVCMTTLLIVVVKGFVSAYGPGIMARWRASQVASHPPRKPILVIARPDCWTEAIDIPSGYKVEIGLIENTPDKKFGMCANNDTDNVFDFNLHEKRYVVPDGWDIVRFKSQETDFVPVMVTYQSLYPPNGK